MKKYYSFLGERNAYLCTDETLVLHCHHYNTYLQLAIEDAKEYLDVYLVLINSAQAIAFQHFKSSFEKFALKTIDERKNLVVNHFKACGFGLIDFNQIEKNGGTVTSSSEHYVIGWLSKFGTRTGKYEKGAALFTTGYLAGAYEAIFNLDLGTLEANQTLCPTLGDEIAKFEIFVRKTKTEFLKSPEQGSFQSFPEFTTHLQFDSVGNIDYDAIRNALTNMEMNGNEKGLIDAFGVLLTKHFSNYYCMISYWFLKLMEEKYGIMGVNIAQELLIEAGQVCAFNTFGGIMISSEWAALVKPMIKNREDWVYGIVGVVNSLGWGFWEVKELIPNKKLHLRVSSGYEANSFLSLYGKSDYPVSFLANGGASGIMNLIYNADITTYPQLDDAFYVNIHKSKDKFVGKQVKCRAMGDEFDEFIVLLAE